MIYESYPWKQDLARRRYLFLRHNTTEHFQENEDGIYTILEKSVFYSAFIIRKLIDFHEKLSDEADRYKINTQKYIPIKEINALHNWPNETSHEWERVQTEKKYGRDLCNWLIHSYVFSFTYNEEGTIEGFFLSSDYDRNKALYYIDINDWLEYVRYISSDSVVALDAKYDPKSKDYIYTRKKRG